jgi:hypothetical protein
MSPDFEMQMKHLREHTADVELGLPVPSGASDLVVATELARSRRVAINRGDRVAYVHKLVNGQRTRHDDGDETGPEIETLVSETECRALIVAGANGLARRKRTPG